ncbi:hypothetical protein TNCV_5071921 [Trichonephila clavipes]|nr:hypothetical protein TNCV_5071921 [Trichonephila clavipes]
MVLKANDRRTSCPCHDEFRGPRSDYVRQFVSGKKNTGLEKDSREGQGPPWAVESLSKEDRKKRGHTSVESDQSSGRTQTTRDADVVEKVEILIMKDCSLKVRWIAKQIEISTGFVHASLCEHLQSDCEICPQAFVWVTLKTPSYSYPGHTGHHQH